MASMHSDSVERQLRSPEIRMPRGWREIAGKPFWERFFEVVTEEIFTRGGFIVDIGGGLRLDAARGDRADPRRQAVFSRYLVDPHVRFHVTDYTDKYHPDSVEDIHRLSFANASVDGLFCLAVLEHVYDPKRAAEELVRVLKPGSTALIYVPFIYRYHANLTEDYRDYFRYSADGIAYLFRGAQRVECCPVRGIFESLLRFTPLHLFPGLPWMLRILDWWPSTVRSISKKQTSGYFIKIVK